MWRTHVANRLSVIPYLPIDSIIASLVQRWRDASDNSGKPYGLCEIAICRADAAPTFGTRSAPTASNSYKVVYDCNTGYTGGPVLATCQPTALFDISAPTCTIGLSFFLRILQFILFGFSYSKLSG